MLNFHLRTRTMKTLLSFSLLLLCLGSFAQISEHIHVDQFGYLPSNQKVAVISNPQVGFNAAESYTPGILQVRNAANDNVVLEGTAEVWSNGQTHFQSGDQGWWFDFSSVVEPGAYYIHDVSTGANSAEFEIASDVYNEVLKSAGRAFYYNRCNSAKAAEHAGSDWADGTSFGNQGQDFDCRDIATPNDSNSARDLSGGWYDAGDFNKYVTFASSAVHDLLWAYQHHPNAFGDDWDIPESGNNVPDILDEVEYELDWIMKMNDPLTGETLLKVGSANYSENVSTPPSLNSDPRYYIGYCSSAAVAAAGVFANAAIVYGNYGEQFNNSDMVAYANQLELRAVITFAYALNYQANNGWDLNCDTGQVVSGDADYNETEQNDGMITAAVYLYDLTGDPLYNNYILNNAAQTEQLTSYFWGVYKTELNSAFLHYTTLENADPILSAEIFTSFDADIQNNGSGYYGLNDDDLYRSAMPDWSYHWGSNLPKANYGILNFLASHYNVSDASTSSSMQLKVPELVHYFHGVNPLGKVYLSNMYGVGGERCVDELYHQWFAEGSIYDHVFNSTVGPAPGFLVGGPNDYYSGSSPFLGNNEPMQKAYADFNDVPSASWEITEPSISYQAAYVRLLAQFVDARSPSTGVAALTESTFVLYPNPTKQSLRVQMEFVPSLIEVLNIHGQVLSSHSPEHPLLNISTADLNPGAYILRVTDTENRAISKKFIRL